MTSFPALSRLFVQTASEQMVSLNRFMKFSESDVKSFSEEQEHANTKKKTTSYNIKLFKEFLASEEEMREIEIPAAELQEFAIKFLLSVGKKNSGDEYEPSSIRGFLQSVGKKDTKFPF